MIMWRNMRRFPKVEQTYPVQKTEEDLDGRGHGMRAKMSRVSEDPQQPCLKGTKVREGTLLRVSVSNFSLKGVVFLVTIIASVTLFVVSDVT